MTFQVTNEQDRRAARKLLRDKGLPTSEVHRMSYAALTAALAEYGIGGNEVEAARGQQQQQQQEAQQSGQQGQPQPGEGGSKGQQGEGEGEQAEGEPKDGKAPSKSKDPDSMEAIVERIADRVMKANKARYELDPKDVAKAIDEAISERVPQIIKVEINGQQTEVEGIAHYMLPEVVKALSAGCHVWMPGPAGSGKSMLARQALKALGYGDDDIFMTGAVETPYELKGYKSPSGDASTLMTPLRRSIERARETGKGAFIFDDTDRSNAKALAAFNEMLANGHASFPDGMVEIPAGWLCVATANTFGLGGGSDYVGAARLDKATLDRFIFLEIPYDERFERLIAGETGAEWCSFVQKVRKACHGLGLKHLVTPRATFKGMKLLAAGMDRKHVEAATVYAGLDGETLARVKGAL